MPNNPKIKFQPELLARRRAEKIVEFHSLGVNGDSVNEFARLVFTQFSLVKPDQLFPALAALKPYQAKNPFAHAGLGLKRVKADPTQP